MVKNENEQDRLDGDQLSESENNSDETSIQKSSEETVGEIPGKQTNTPDGTVEEPASVPDPQDIDTPAKEEVSGTSDPSSDSKESQDKQKTPADAQISPSKDSDGEEVGKKKEVANEPSHEIDQGLTGETDGSKESIEEQPKEETDPKKDKSADPKPELKRIRKKAMKMRGKKAMKKHTWTILIIPKNKWYRYLRAC